MNSKAFLSDPFPHAVYFDNWEIHNQTSILPPEVQQEGWYIFDEHGEYSGPFSVLQCAKELKIQVGVLIQKLEEEGED